MDGTSLKSMSYPEGADAYRPGTERQHGWNLFHINALYGLENGVYTDIIVQKEHTKHESRALCQMADRAKKLFSIYQTTSERVIIAEEDGVKADEKKLSE